MDLEKRESLQHRKVEQATVALKTLKESQPRSSFFVQLQEDSLKQDIRELEQVQMQLHEDPIDYGLAPNCFIKKALHLLGKSPLLTDYKLSHTNHPFTVAMHIGLKGYRHPETERLQFHYERANSSHMASIKFQFAFELLEQTLKSPRAILGINSLEEREGLFNICRMRHNMAQYKKLIWEQENVKAFDIYYAILEDIEALSDPSSERVIHLPNGDSLFAIPSGWTGNCSHFMAIEFRRDAKGDYFFVIHNRDSFSHHSGLHGSLVFEKDGKTYAKTRVAIHTSKEALVDDYLMFLITALLEHGSDIQAEEVYAKIEKHLIINAKGKIVHSQAEQLALSLAEMEQSPFLDVAEKQKIKKAIPQLLASDPNFHSVQYFATCTESNVTTLEKQIAPSSVIRVLKRYTLISLTNQIANKWLKPNINPREALKNLKNHLPKCDAKIVGHIEDQLSALIEAEAQTEEAKHYWSNFLVDSSVQTLRQAEINHELFAISKKLEGLLSKIDQNWQAIESILETINDLDELNAGLADFNELKFKEKGLTTGNFTLLIQNAKNHFLRMTHGFKERFSKQGSRPFAKYLSQIEYDIESILKLRQQIQDLKVEHDVNPRVFFVNRCNKKHSIIKEIRTLLTNLRSKADKKLTPLFDDLDLCLVEKREAKIFSFHLQKRIEQLQQKLQKPPSRSVMSEAEAVKLIDSISETETKIKMNFDFYNEKELPSIFNLELKVARQKLAYFMNRSEPLARKSLKQLQVVVCHYLVLLEKHPAFDVKKEFIELNQDLTNLLTDDLKPIKSWSNPLSL
jgi:hypothetical protein